MYIGLIIAMIGAAIIFNAVASIEAKAFKKSQAKHANKHWC